MDFNIHHFVSALTHGCDRIIFNYIVLWACGPISAAASICSIKVECVSFCNVKTQISSLYGVTVIITSLFALVFLFISIFPCWNNVRCTFSVWLLYQRSFCFVFCCKMNFFLFMLLPYQPRPPHARAKQTINKVFINTNSDVYM